MHNPGAMEAEAEGAQMQPKSHKSTGAAPRSWRVAQAFAKERADGEQRRRAKGAQPEAIQALSKRYAGSPRATEAGAEWRTA